MATVEQNLERILTAKADLKTAIEAKGVTVPSATLIDGYADLVDQIPTGGGGYTGHVDTEGLQALGWDADDIAWLQAHVWWNEEDDAEWAVTAANRDMGPNGATPLTWANRANFRNNPDLRYFPKLDTPSGNNIQILLATYYQFVVAIPAQDWDMTGKTVLLQMFSNCVSLRSLGDISRWNTSSVTNVSQMFGNCISLQEINLSGWDTGSVSNFSGMFSSCRSLRTADISGFSFASATNASSIFSNCHELREVKLPVSWTAPSLTTIASMFYLCAHLEKVTLPTLSASSLTALQDLFSGCNSLREVSLSIASNAINQIKTVFANCFQVEEIDFSSIDTSGVNNAAIGTTDYQAPFYACYSAKRIVLGPKFFAGSFTTIFCTSLMSWTRDSIYESLYTNQTLRTSSSPAVTVRLNTDVYDRLSSQDRDDIATKNITLQRG